MNESRSLLLQLVERLNQLCQLLSEESHCLKEGKTEDLARLAALKAECARDLTNTWAAVISQLGLTPPLTRAAFEQSLQRIADTRLRDIWFRIEKLIAETDRLNRQNGLIIEEQLGRTQRALEILQAAAMEQAIYGADGFNVTFTRQHSIGEA